MRRHIGWVTGWVMVMGLGITLGHADDKATTPPGMDAAAMQKAQALMTPGAEHKALEPMIGRWSAKVSGWMKPGDKPQVSAGTAENTWVLNNHFVKQEFSGSWAGQPFSGIGFTGYDKVREEYQSIWMDNMGTGMMYSSGPLVTGSQTILESGTFGCPMTGEKNRWTRSEVKFSGPDKFVYASYSKGPDGKEFKGMEIVYTRAK